MMLQTTQASRLLGWDRRWHVTLQPNKRARKFTLLQQAASTDRKRNNPSRYSSPVKWKVDVLARSRFTPQTVTSGKPFPKLPEWDLLRTRLGPGRILFRTTTHSSHHHMDPPCTYIAVTLTVTAVDTAHGAESNGMHISASSPCPTSLIPQWTTNSRQAGNCIGCSQWVSRVNNVLTAVSILNDAHKPLGNTASPKTAFPTAPALPVVCQTRVASRSATTDARSGPNESG